MPKARVQHQRERGRVWTRVAARTVQKGWKKVGEIHTDKWDNNTSGPVSLSPLWKQLLPMILLTPTFHLNFMMRERERGSNCGVVMWWVTNNMQIGEGDNNKKVNQHLPIPNPAPFCCLNLHHKVEDEKEKWRVNQSPHTTTTTTTTTLIIFSYTLLPLFIFHHLFQLF